MTLSVLARSAEIPSHVPRDRVVDVDLYRMPGSEDDLHDSWKRLQDSSPSSLVWTPRNGGHWIVTRGCDIARIYADHENFSSNITIVPREWGERFPLRPTTLDPPEHRRYRRFINAALSSPAVRAADPKIRELAIGAIERFRASGRCEVISEFAGHIPLGLFLHLANLPDADALTLPRYAEDPVASDGSSPEIPIMHRFAHYLRPYVVERQRHPGDDLISGLVTHTVDGRRLTEDEAVDVAVALMTGGIDTVVSVLGFVMIFLAQHHGHRGSLVADPTLIRPAVTEMLRRFPIMTKARLVRCDQEIEGVTLKAGDMVVLPPLHGLDEREFDDPMTVDFKRAQSQHSAFGNGVHRCPGAHLAHTELEVTLQEWLARIPEFEIDPLRPPRMRSGILGAVLHVGLQWDPSTTRAVDPLHTSD